jgi:hypothetical protein
MEYRERPDVVKTLLCLRRLMILEHTASFSAKAGLAGFNDMNCGQHTQVFR